MVLLFHYIPLFSSGVVVIVLNLIYVLLCDRLIEINYGSCFVELNQTNVQNSGRCRIRS